MVSIRKDVDNGSFKMPSPIPLETTMFDFLEDKVDDKYYLSDKYIEYAENLTAKQIESGGGFRFCPVERERERVTIAKTITTKAGIRVTDNFIKEVIH